MATIHWSHPKLIICLDSLVRSLSDSDATQTVSGLTHNFRSSTKQLDLIQPQGNASSLAVSSPTKAPPFAMVVVSKLQSIAQLAIPVAEPTLQLDGIGARGGRPWTISTKCVSLFHEFLDSQRNSVATGSDAGVVFAASASNCFRRSASCSSTKNVAVCSVAFANQIFGPRDSLSASFENIPARSQPFVDWGTREFAQGNVVETPLHLNPSSLPPLLQSPKGSPGGRGGSPGGSPGPVGAEGWGAFTK